MARRVRACPRPPLALEGGWTNQRSPPRVQPFCKKIKQVCRPTFASDLQFFFLCNGRVSVKERDLRLIFREPSRLRPVFFPSHAAAVRDNPSFCGPPRRSAKSGKSFERFFFSSHQNMQQLAGANFVSSRLALLLAATLVGSSANVRANLFCVL